MSEAGEASLHVGGGSCPPFQCPPYGASPEEWEAFCAARGLGAAGVGSKPSYHIDVGAGMNYNLFEQPAIEEMSNNMFGVAGHRSNSNFGLSRILDFSVPDNAGPRVTGIKMGKGWPNQDGLIKWWRQNMERIVDGFCLNVVGIPCQHLLRGVQICNVCPIPGLVYSVKLKYQDVMLAEGIDGSVQDGMYVPIPPAVGFRKDKNEVIQIVLDSVPPKNEDQCKPGCGHLEDWCVAIAGDVFCGMTGK